MGNSKSHFSYAVFSGKSVLMSIVPRKRNCVISVTNSGFLGHSPAMAAVFYRVLSHFFERFLAEYESRFEREYGLTSIHVMIYMKNDHKDVCVYSFTV